MSLSSSGRFEASLHKASVELPEKILEGLPLGVEERGASRGASSEELLTGVGGTRHTHPQPQPQPHPHPHPHPHPQCAATGGIHCA